MDLETSLSKNGLENESTESKQNEALEPPPLVPVAKKKLKNEIKEETSALERVISLSDKKTLRFCQDDHIRDTLQVLPRF